jgi:hypothetical protein
MPISANYRLDRWTGLASCLMRVPSFLQKHEAPDFMKLVSVNAVNSNDRRASHLSGTLEEEVENSRCDLIAVCLQCEMPGIE